MLLRPGACELGFFSVATVNVGSADTIEASVRATSVAPETLLI